MRAREQKSAAEIAKRKAAWAKVGQDVFPLWSSPKRFTQPLRRWDGWSDDHEVGNSIPSLAPAPTTRRVPSPRLTPPGPESPFYVAPASDRALRRYLAVLWITPIILAAVIITALLTRQWAELCSGLAIAMPYAFIRWVQVRPVLRELSRRKTARGA